MGDELGGVPGRERRDAIFVLAPRTSSVAEMDRHLSMHGVIAVFGRLRPAIRLAEAARLFAEHLDIAL